MNIWTTSEVWGISGKIFYIFLPLIFIRRITTYRNQSFVVCSTEKCVRVDWTIFVSESINSYWMRFLWSGLIKVEVGVISRSRRLMQPFSDETLLIILDIILLNNLRLDDVTGTDFENSLYAFGQSEKRQRVRCIIICVNCRAVTIMTNLKIEPMCYDPNSVVYHTKEFRLHKRPDVLLGKWFPSRTLREPRSLSFEEAGFWP